MVDRKRPNILVTGTPGSGKTSLCEELVEKLGMKSIRVGDLVKEKDLHNGYDSEFDTFLIDEASEDRILDELEPIMEEGGVVLEHHTVSFFPERFFDLVLVLSVDNEKLYDRLKLRGYSQKKIEENVTCEIMRVVADEALEFYDPSIVIELPSNSLDDLSENVSRTCAWYDSWMANNS